MQKWSDSAEVASHLWWVVFLARAPGKPQNCQNFDLVGVMFSREGNMEWTNQALFWIPNTFWKPEVIVFYALCGALYYMMYLRSVTIKSWIKSIHYSSWASYDHNLLYILLATSSELCLWKVAASAREVVLALSPSSRLSSSVNGGKSFYTLASLTQLCRICSSWYAVHVPLRIALFDFAWKNVGLSSFYYYLITCFYSFQPTG